MRINGICRASLLLFALMGMSAAQAADVVNVFVSILPQKYLVERIGGNRVHVEVMVRPGLNAETYEPSPHQMAALSKANVYFRIGVPFESIWIKKISAANPNLWIIDCCHALMPEGSQYGKDDTARHVYDAHVWTSPRNAVHIADIMLSALTDIDPAAGEYYEKNHAALVRDLDDLDQFIKQQFSSLGNRYLMVAHPSWGHFSDAYGLTQIPLERHGTEIRPRELSGLVKFAKKNNIHTVYIDKQFNSAAARLLARETGAKIVVLDPLAEDYINNLKDVTQAIVAGSR
jgi:zinc transport system substrate-binding protein